MNKLTLGTAAAVLALAIPAAASAQQLPAAVIAVVDTGRILQQCTACTAANTQLQAQAQQLQQRAQQLNQPLETEAQSIQTAISALPQGQQPDAGLQARIRTFRSQQETAQRELQTRQETLQRNRNFVLQQIEQRLSPIVSQVMTQRGAVIAMDRSSTMAHNASIEITDAVLAGLNQQLPTVNVNAPPPAQQPAQQPAPQQPQQRRPQGR